MTDATMILNEDGTAADASPAALQILGVTLDQLRELPTGAFSATEPDPAADAAFREQWERQGSPDIGGEATLRRLDGEQIRVKFAISPLDDGRYQAVLIPVGGATDAPPTLYTAGEVLAEWRAAERRLAALPPDSPEIDAVHADIAAFRTRYQDVFKRSA
jgi:PAS domain S-box-containing protein